MPTDVAKTKADEAELLETTIDLIIAGLSSPKILGHLRGRYTNAPRSEKHAQDLIAEAGQHLRQRFNEHADTAMEVSLIRLNDLYARSVRIQDYKTCLAIQREINVLRKLAEARDRPEEPASDEASPSDHPLKVTPDTIGDRYRETMRREGKAG